MNADNVVDPSLLLLFNDSPVKVLFLFCQPVESDKPEILRARKKRRVKRRVFAIKSLPLWSLLFTFSFFHLVFIHVDEKIFLFADKQRTIIGGFNEESCKPLTPINDMACEWEIPWADWDAFCEFYSLYFCPFYYLFNIFCNLWFYNSWNKVEGTF